MRGELGQDAGDDEGEDGGEMEGDEGFKMFSLAAFIKHSSEQFNWGHDWSDRAV